MNFIYIYQNCEYLINFVFNGYISLNYVYSLLTLESAWYVFLLTLRLSHFISLASFLTLRSSPFASKKSFLTLQTSTIAPHPSLKKKLHFFLSLSDACHFYTQNQRSKMSFQSTSSASCDGASSEATSNSSDVANRRGLELDVDGTQLNATVDENANLSPAFALATSKRWA